MIKITNIELNKKYKAEFKGITAVVNYHIHEDWFSVSYWDGELFLGKNTHSTTSEQLLLHILRQEINAIT